MSPPIVYSNSSYEYMRSNLCALGDFTCGRLERQCFPDGERLLRILDDVRGQDVVVIGGTIDDMATLEVFDLACGLVGLGVNTLSLVIPYFGHSTQERASKPGEVVTAKTRAILISAIPSARLTNEVVLFDLHTPGIAHYFEGHIRSLSLSALPLELQIVRNLASRESVTVATTDAGRAKWVAGLANEAGVPAAFVYKARVSGAKTVVTGINADVKGRHVIIYDDMIRTGSSLIEAGRAYKQAGATRITAMATHGVLPGDSLQQIMATGLFEALYCTDSHPRAVALAAQFPGFLRLQPLTSILADFFTARSG